MIRVGYCLLLHGGVKYSSFGKEKGTNMFCTKCGSNQVTISIQQSSAKTKKYGNSFGGHMNNLARGLTAACTLGISNLVWKKSKGGEKTVITNEKICLCQNCGNSWIME